MSGEWLRTGEAARMLSVSRDSIRRKVERGELVARRWDNGWIQVERASVLRLLRLLRSGNEQPPLGEWSHD